MYLWDQRKQPVNDAISAFYDTLSSEEDNPKRAEPDAYMEKLVYGATEKSTEIDARIAVKSENWRLERMPAVDRNILRLAVYEMQLGTPPAVVIDEALELARQFSGDDSVAFINGVLDAINRSSS